ncbi:hypothetical protein ACFYYB_13800 [Streptomyces sp. NPDC002886]|uniref:hypothetical protein n=1 Tax=Streptomyces sp. NPDC002886 TaxID=3364667 RepID=UPI00367EFFF0
MTGEEPLWRVHHIGDRIDVSGTGNIGKVVNTHHAPQAQPPALQDLIRLIEVLRGQVSGDDLADIDASLETVREGEAAAPGAVRRALDTVLRIATVIGEAGVPVLTAITQFRALSA